MNPAFSAILFTTLSGMGYGVLAWLGMMIFASRLEFFARDLDAAFSSMLLLTFVLVLLGIGLALTAIGLLSSLFHLGKPTRAWRAYSQWRTSWLSREGVMATATFFPGALLIGALASTLLEGTEGGLANAIRWGGGILAMFSIVTVACTAMIYASLKPVPAWSHRLVVPVYLMFALLNGLALFASILASVASKLLSVEIFHYLAGALCALAVALAMMKLAYWRAIDHIVLPSRESATALEGIGKVTTFERPHTEANYLTREMGFVLARKHSRKLRVIALVLFAVVPLLALFAAWLLPAASTVALWTAAIAAMLGAFVERWLFFAEAKHMVTLYY